MFVKHTRRHIHQQSRIQNLLENPEKETEKRDHGSIFVFQKCHQFT
jgi:NAD(P)H-hydrate repair Nnr-like enzyme with NAD(P)H-hydrate dehydratase domain